jgi:UDP-N-acetylmuramyl tripeptide synthase
MPARARVALALGRAASRLSRALGRGEGAVIGGKVALTVDPGVVDVLGAGRRVALVTGTNGKTTTTALLAAALRTAGPVVSNESGANLATGHVAALFGAPGVETAALEVDEAVLPWAIEHERPVTVVLLNLSRDQLDRLHEVRRTAGVWRAALASRPGVHVVANADDPVVVSAVPAGAGVTWVAAGQWWRLDATSCPQCGSVIGFEGEWWACPTCGLSRPSPQVVWDDEKGVCLGGSWHPLSLQLPGRFNRGNAAMAAAAAVAMGVDGGASLAAMASVGNVADRYVVRPWGSGGGDGGVKQVRMLLAKNPAGWLEVLELLAGSDADSVVVALNARGEDGTDPSWIYDVPFERLRGRQVVCAGERAADLAVRLAYAGVDYTFAPAPAEALDAAAGRSVDLAANYSAFQQFRRVVRHGR